MIWNNHLELRDDAHAFLSPSQYHWINYDDEKLIERYTNMMAVERGTRLHNLAAELIDLGQRLPSRPKKTLSMYVNDAIGFKMNPEQKLKYSDNCFGKADAISFRNNFLRIHDLKTGVTPAHMEQLIAYAALFCLEYKYKPGSIEMELRIYQNNEIDIFNPTAEDILPVMDTIVHFDKLIEEIKERER